MVLVGFLFVLSYFSSCPQQSEMGAVKAAGRLTECNEK